MGGPDWTDVRNVDGGVMLAGYLLTIAQAEALARTLNDAARRGKASEDWNVKVATERAVREAFRARCVVTVDVGLGIVGIDAAGRPWFHGRGVACAAEWFALDKLGAEIGRPVAWHRSPSGTKWHRKGCGCALDWWRLSCCLYLPAGEVPEGRKVCAATRCKWGVK